MKKLFYRLSSSRSLAKLFSMHARLEKRSRVMFSKSSVFAVVALAAFVSLGAFLFPHVGHAQSAFGTAIWAATYNNSLGVILHSLSTSFIVLTSDCVKI